MSVWRISWTNKREFPDSHSNGPIMPNFDFFFISMNKLLNKQSKCWRFEILWRSCGIIVMYFLIRGKQVSLYSAYPVPTYLLAWKQTQILGQTAAIGISLSKSLDLCRNLCKTLTLWGPGTWPSQAVQAPGRSHCWPSQIAKFIGPTWGPHWCCRPQMGLMLAPWTLLSVEY